MELPKIDFDKLVRTNLSCPCEWKYDNVRLHFRLGALKIFIDEKLIHTTCKNQFDIGAFLSDEDLKIILERDKMLLLPPAA